MGLPRLRRMHAVLLGLVLLGSSGREAWADPLYTITDLGTLPGTTQSIATGINASGQVTGVSYSSSDGTWTTGVVLGPAGPSSYDAGAKSFLFSNGQMTQINPVDGPANAINDSGQVVGGHYSSINDSGQYVGSGDGGLIYQGQSSFPGQLVSGGEVTTPLPILPYAINNAGQIVGWVSAGSTTIHAAIAQNGHVTDLSAEFGLKGLADVATAISGSGYVLLREGQMSGSDPVHYLLYNPTGYHFNGDVGPSITDLTALPGGSGRIALALNNLGQVVGNGFLYAGGQFLSLQSLLPAPLSSQWSNLNATGINDAGQIVGQGLINGQEHAFLMTPHGSQVPEPSTLLIFGLASAALALRWVLGRSRR